MASKLTIKVLKNEEIYISHPNTEKIINILCEEISALIQETPGINDFKDLDITFTVTRKENNQVIGMH